MLTDFHEISITGILLMNEGYQPYAYFKTTHFVKYFGSVVEKFSQTYNRDSFDEMIKIRGNNPMLTSDLHVW